jgi:hypothetical protein
MPPDQDMMRVLRSAVQLARPRPPANTSYPPACRKSILFTQEMRYIQENFLFNVYFKE